MAVWIILAVVAVVPVVVAILLLETAIVVNPGTVALVLRRGKATGRALPPGRHFVAPWQKLMLQIYPSRELCLVAGGRTIDDTRVEYADDALRVHLGDKALARISYTVRCQLDPSSLRDVHDRYGPEGIWAALRDTVRSTLLAEIGNGQASIDDAYGTEFVALEQRLTAALGAALADIGFDLKMFSLREVDLGETGEVIQATVRADAELGREQALAKVRTARLENDLAVNSLVEGLDGDTMLRYRQIESWRDIVQRWNGDQPIPAALTLPLTLPLGSAATADLQAATDDDAPDAATEES
jgi:regulator of protease activity HflC (stomatin/prohibitin superfamily)